MAAARANARQVGRSVRLEIPKMNRISVVNLSIYQIIVIRIDKYKIQSDSWLLVVMDI